MAFYEEFQVLITRRMGEQSIISQVPGIVALVNKLVESGFQPVLETTPTALPPLELKEAGKENKAHIFPIHGVEMKKFTICQPSENRYNTPFSCLVVNDIHVD